MDECLKVEHISMDEIPAILDLKWHIFCQHYADRDDCDAYTMSSVDWGISVKLTFHGELVGMYLLREACICRIAQEESIETLYEDLCPYQSLAGVQGVTLGLLEEHRGLGWGTLLKDYPASMGYDYWVGLAFKSLGNLADWQKRARLVGENSDEYLLLEDYPGSRGRRNTGCLIRA